MNRVFYVIAVVVLLGGLAAAQRTAVSATMRSPDGDPWPNCKGSASFVDLSQVAGQGPHTTDGSTFQKQVNFSCDSFGHFATTLTDNNFIRPAPSAWLFAICSAAGYTAGPYCFSVQLTITGSAQDITTQLQAAAPNLPRITGNGDVVAANNNAFTGNNTHSGLETFNNVNGVRFADHDGAKCDGTTDDSAALSASFSANATAHGLLVISPGKVCAFATPLVVTGTNYGILMGSGAMLKYTGVGGIALTLDGSAVADGAEVNVSGPLVIDAPAGTSCLKTIKIVRSPNIEAECRGATGTAFITDFAVANRYWLKASSNTAPFSSTPTTGLLVTNATAASIKNDYWVILEGINGDGVVLQGVNENKIEGTSEGNAGRGVYITGTSSNGNELSGTHLEDNAAACSIEFDGGIHRGTQLTNVAGGNLCLGAATKETAISGGIYNNITIASGALATTFSNGVRRASVTDLNDPATTTTQYIGENAATQNTLGVTSFIRTPIFTVSPLLLNDIPLQAKTSGGGICSPFWLTAADQTLVQFCSDTAVLKIRNGSTGADKLTVDNTTVTSRVKFVVGDTAERASIDQTTGKGTFGSVSAPMPSTANVVLPNPLAADCGNAQLQFDRPATITRVSCNTGPTAGDASLDINLNTRSAASPNTSGTNVLTTPLTCSATATASTTTITNPSVPARTPVAICPSGVGTPGLLRLYVELTFAQ